MDRKNDRSEQMVLQDLCIVFVGDPARGHLIQLAIGTNGWRICETMDAAPDSNQCIPFKPDLLILDKFPDSQVARAAYYHPCYSNAVPVLALNETPGALKYMHTGALSFLRIIDRKPSPKNLIDTITDLVTTYRKRQAGGLSKSGLGKIPLQMGHPRLHGQLCTCCC